MNIHLSEQEIIRREKRVALEELGIDPYPATEFPVTHTSIQIKGNYSVENKEHFQDISFAGRIMSVRDMGKASFAVLQDHVGRIQIYIKRDDICPGEDKTLYDTVWKKLIDIGDIIGVKGFVFVTRTGEISIHVKEYSVLSKSLKPLPVVKEAEGQTFDAVTDPEFKYRQRYADLVLRANVDDDVKVLVIRGVGEHLGSGADLPEMAGMFNGDDGYSPLPEFRIGEDEGVRYPPRDSYRYIANVTNLYADVRFGLRSLQDFKKISII